MMFFLKEDILIQPRGKGIQDENMAVCMPRRQALEKPGLLWPQSQNLWPLLPCASHSVHSGLFSQTEYTFSCIECGSMPLHQSGALHRHYTTLTFAKQGVYILTSLFYKACSNHSRIEISAFFTMLLSILHSFFHAFIKTRESCSQSHHKNRDQSSIAYCLSLNYWSTQDSLWKGKCLSFLKLAISYFEQSQI